MAGLLLAAFSRHRPLSCQCLNHTGFPSSRFGSAKPLFVPPKTSGCRPNRRTHALTGGLILVTGPTGMGKTTTLNFMINAINEDRRAKIITIEDPVEFAHENLRSIVIQRKCSATSARSRRRCETCCDKTPM